MKKSLNVGLVPARQRVMAPFENADPSSLDLTLELDARVETELRLYDERSPSVAPKMQALRARLPDWVALDARELRMVKRKILTFFPFLHRAPHVVSFVHKARRKTGGIEFCLRRQNY